MYIRKLKDILEVIFFKNVSPTSKYIYISMSTELVSIYEVKILTRKSNKIYETDRLHSAASSGF